MEPPWAVRRLVGIATATAQGPRSGSTRRTRGGDFYLATSGDLHLAINEDFPMAMDTPADAMRNLRSLRDARRVQDDPLHDEFRQCAEKRVVGPPEARTQV